MSSTREKAESLVNQYIELSDIWTDTAVKCAITHVKGIIDCLDRLDFSLEIDQEVKYWQQVLNELNQM